LRYRLSRAATSALGSYNRLQEIGGADVGGGCLLGQMRQALADRCQAQLLTQFCDPIMGQVHLKKLTGFPAITTLDVFNFDMATGMPKARSSSWRPFRVCIG
jgi:hypothetical protein